MRDMDGDLLVGDWRRTLSSPPPSAEIRPRGVQAPSGGKRSSENVYF